jgi:cytochrome c
MAPAGFALAKQWAACVVGALFLFPLGAGAADAERGKQLFEQCAACHALGGAPVDMGPSLKGVFGRTAGTLEDFRYSPVMRRSGIVWNRQTLDAFLADPQSQMRGNRMPFSGMPDRAEREDLLEYLERASR